MPRFTHRIFLIMIIMSLVFGAALSVHPPQAQAQFGLFNPLSLGKGLVGKGKDAYKNWKENRKKKKEKKKNKGSDDTSDGTSDATAPTSVHVIISGKTLAPNDKTKGVDGVTVYCIYDGGKDWAGKRYPPGTESVNDKKLTAQDWGQVTKEGGRFTCDMGTITTGTVYVVGQTTIQGANYWCDAEVTIKDGKGVVENADIELQADDEKGTSSIKTVDSSGKLIRTDLTRAFPNFSRKDFIKTQEDGFFRNLKAGYYYAERTQNGTINSGIAYVSGENTGAITFTSYDQYRILYMLEGNMDYSDIVGKSGQLLNVLKTAHDTGYNTVLIVHPKPDKLRDPNNSFARGLRIFSETAVKQYNMKLIISIASVSHDDNTTQITNMTKWKSDMSAYANFFTGDIKPAGYFINWDEFRKNKGVPKSAGPWLASNYRQLRNNIILAADPTAQIFVWNDMLDPCMNGTRTYGDHDWTGGWEAVDKSDIIINWSDDGDNNASKCSELRGKPMSSFQFWKARGNRQIIGGFLDFDESRGPYVQRKSPRPFMEINKWYKSAADAIGPENLSGVMFFTYGNFYGQLGPWMDLFKSTPYYQGSK